MSLSLSFFLPPPSRSPSPSSHPLLIPRRLLSGTSVLDGYNVCIFAYGQTGSGKTYTMEGTANDRGINYEAIGKLFTLMDQRAKDFESTVSISLMEIYNETLRDLLRKEEDGDDDRSGQKKLDIRLDKKLGSTVPGLTTVPCTTSDDVFRSMRCVECGVHECSTLRIHVHECYCCSYALSVSSLFSGQMLYIHCLVVLLSFCSIDSQSLFYIRSVPQPWTSTLNHRRNVRLVLSFFTIPPSNSLTHLRNTTTSALPSYSISSSSITSPFPIPRLPPSTASLHSE